MSIVTIGRRRISFRIETRQTIHTGDVLQEAMYPRAEPGHPIVREEIKYGTQSFGSVERITERGQGSDFDRKRCSLENSIFFFHAL